MKILVIDIGGAFIKTAIMDEKAEILERNRVAADSTKETVLKEKLSEILSLYGSSVEGVAISCAGRVDGHEGTVKGGPIADYRQLELTDFVKETSGLPCTVNNDGKCAVLAEKWLGVLKDVDNGLVYVLGTGIGGGIILNGELYEGSSNASGEFSGALQRVWEPLGLNNLMAFRLSVSAMLQQYSRKTGKNADGFAFFEAVRNSEAEAVEVFEEMTSATAGYLYTLQSILDVQRIAIGGGVSAEPLLLEKIKEKYHGFYSGEIVIADNEAEIVKCRFGNDANLIGALYWYISETSGKEC